MRCRTLLLAATVLGVCACGSDDPAPTGSSGHSSVIAETSSSPSSATPASSTETVVAPTNGSELSAASTVPVSTTAETLEEDPQPTVLAALPTVSTVQLPGPVSPLPTNEVVNPDLDEHCTRLYEVMTGMSLGRYVPEIAKPLKFDIGTGEKVGCEMYFPGFAIAWVDAARDRFQPTEDADETQLMMSSGNVGFFDPTGNDGDEFGGVGVICVPQPDGTVVKVAGFETADLDVTFTIADGFDQSLADSRG